MPVPSAEDPRERFTRKDQVLLLAVLLTRPQTQLSGYDELPTGPVLYSDFPVRLVVERPANSDDDKGNVNSPESSADDTESAVKNSPMEAKDSVDPAGDKDEKPPMEENETGSAEVPGSADSSYRL